MTKVKDKTSPQVGSYDCSLCQKQFKWESERKRHELSHNPQYECNICNKKYSFLSALRRHEKTHERMGPVRCKECAGTFRDETLLKRHLKYAHNGETFTCSKCLAFFSSIAALTSHSKTHTVTDRRYKCQFEGCHKSFNFPHHLKHHELTHTGSKQYFCSVCGKGFIQAHHLKTHLLNHKPDAWLSCPLPTCNKTFHNQNALKRHIFTHKNKELDISDSKIVADENMDLANTRKGYVLCDTCGELINTTQISKHVQKCLKKTKEIVNTTTDSETSEELSNSSFEIFAEIDDGVSISEMVKIGINRCKNGLKTCSITEDGKPDENCLCASIATSPNDISLDDIKPEPIEIKSEVTYEKLDTQMKCLTFCERKKTHPKAIEEIIKNNSLNCKRGCIMSSDGKPNENCYCAKIAKNQTVTENTKKLSDCDNCKVKCENYYKLNDNNGNTKLINNVNSNEELTNNVNDNEELINNIIDNDELKFDKNKVNKCKIHVEDLLLYSCKAVLGNCIVSGDGTIGEGCLCAKMYNNVSRSHEIEDINPLSSMIWTN